jgi:hypothetical protein
MGIDARNPERSLKPSAAAFMVEWELDALLAVRLLFRTEDPGIAPAFRLVSIFGFGYQRTNLPETLLKRLFEPGSMHEYVMEF